jgi:Matrixin
MPEAPARLFSPDVNPNRVRLIRISEKKWVNGTDLHYYFFDKPTDGERVFLADGMSQFIPWATTDEEKVVVRAAFKKWKDAGIGLDFEEVSSCEDAEVRIGFMRGDGAGSFVSRDALNFGPNERTMNFGWTLTRRSSEIDTAVHEIGHLVGFPHERKNPNAGIVWN